MKKETRSMLKDFLIRLSIACALFLIVYLIVTFHPQFLPIDAEWIQKILAEEKLPLSW